MIDNENEFNGVSENIYENNLHNDIDCDQSDQDGEDELEQCKRRKILVSKRRIINIVTTSDKDNYNPTVH